MSTDDEVNAQLDHRKHIYLLLQNVDRIFEIMTNIYVMLKRKKERNCPPFYAKFYMKLNKMMMFMLTGFLITLTYYFYIFWNIIPKLEGTPRGFTLKFWTVKNWYDDEYRYAMTNFIIFHCLILISLICLLRTIFSNPGYLHSDYSDIYSTINFIKVFFQYITHYKKVGYKLELKSNNSISEDIKMILDMNKSIKAAIAEYKESYL